MWFGPDKQGRRRLFKKGNEARNRPSLVLNARIRQRRRVWAYRLGLLGILAAALGLAGALGWAGATRASAALFSGNPEYTVTPNRVFIRCDNAELREYVRRQMRLDRTTNLFLVNIEALHREITLTPSVKSATIYRRLPGSLEVKIQERVPVARLAGPRELNRSLVVDNEAFVFSARSRSVSASLPWIVGYRFDNLNPGARMGGHVERAVALIECCRGSRVGSQLQVAGVEIGDNILRVHLAGGTVALLAWKEGDGETRFRDLNDRLEYLVGILVTRKKQGKPVRTVDLTFEHYKEYAPVTPM